MRRAVALALLVVTCGPGKQERQAREAALAHDLFEMRKAIDDFRADKKRGPHSLSELKTTHYLRDIPPDPLTGSRNWRVTIEEPVRNDDFTTGTPPAQEPDVVEVHSRAAGKDTNGKPYADY